MLLGYNTNGLAHHAPETGIPLLADLGYRSIAITLDHGWLNPYAFDFTKQLTGVSGLLARHGLRSVIETGARFLLDPRQKHEPTLVSAAAEARGRRIEFLKQAIDVAAALDSDCVSLWSGVLRDGAADQVALERLEAGLAQVLRHAEHRRVKLGFEPEPGMFIDTMERFAALQSRLRSPWFRLTLDVGHVHCLGDGEIPTVIAQWKSELVNIHIEDMRRGVHEHLPFGEGEMNFPPIIAALAEANYSGGLHVELSRHSHQAPEAARRAIEFLRPLMRG